MSPENNFTECNPPAPVHLPGMSWHEEQVGGGRRLPSPPPVLTPTRLRTAVKATTCDIGLVRSAQARRARFLEEAPPFPEGGDDIFSAPPQMPPSGQNAILCASLLFDGEATGENVSFYSRAATGDDQSQSVVATDIEAPAAIAVAGRHDGEHVLPTGDASSWPSQAVSEKGLSANHENVQACAHTPEASTTDNTSKPTNRPSPPLILDDGEPIVESLFFDEDTPRPAAGVLPTMSSPMDFDAQSDGGWSLRLTNDHLERPETPSPPERASKRVRIASPTNGAEAQRAIVGRPSGLVINTLQDAFQRIDDQFHDLSGQVGMPFHQVVARYTKQFARMNSGNFWNLYQKYSMANKATELARVPEADVVNGTPSSRLARCYKLFCDEFPDTWHEILTTFEEVDAMEEHTVSHRGIVFNKLAKNFKHSFSAMAKAHAFEGVFVMAGSVVNQDAGLGFTFATPGAEDFFPDRCRVDHNDILGHFKAHIYNRASLNYINLAFEDANEEGSSTKRDVESPHTGVEEAKDDDQDDQEDHAGVRKAFISALLKVGCKWAAGKLFPWKGLPGKLAKSGVTCHNYPDDVPFPGEERQSRSKGGSKGISDLTLAECSTLVGALMDTSKEGLSFKLALPDMKGSIQQSRVPVIYGAAPAPGSAHSHAKRMFADLTIDRKGVARKKNVALTRIKKKKEKQRADDVISDDVISIDYSSDIAVQTAPAASKNRRAGVVVDLTESADSSNGHRELPVEVVIKRPVRKAAKRKLDLEPEEQEDLSSPSGSDYQPDDIVEVGQDAEGDDDEGSVVVEEQDVTSRKCKGKVDSSHPPKKPLVSKWYQPDDAVDSGQDTEGDDDKGLVIVEEQEVASRKRKRKADTLHLFKKLFVSSKGKHKAYDVQPLPKKRVHVGSKSLFDSSDESDCVAGPSRNLTSQVKPTAQSADISPPSAPIAPPQDYHAADAIVSIPSVNVPPLPKDPKDITSAPQEDLPSGIASVGPPHGIIYPTVPSLPSAADPLPLASTASNLAPRGVVSPVVSSIPSVAVPLRPGTAQLDRPHPKPRLVTTSGGPRRTEAEDGEDPFSMRKRCISVAAPVSIVDSDASQLQAAEEGRAGDTLIQPPATVAPVAAPAPAAAVAPVGTAARPISVPAPAVAAGDTLIQPPATVAPVAAPAPAAAVAPVGTAARPISVPTPAVALAPPPFAVIAPKDTVTQVADTSGVSECVVFPRLPPPPQEGRERAPANENAPAGFNDHLPVMGGSWYPHPLHPYPLPGTYAQWPSYVELDHARARNSMVPPVHPMGFPGNMPSFDIANYYYHGQPAFMGTQPTNSSFMDGRTHPGMSLSSATSLQPESVPGRDVNEDGRAASK